MTQFKGPDYSTGLPPNVKRHWELTTDELALVIWNMKKKKGITLRTTRPYIVFSQLAFKFVRDITSQEVREGLRALSDCGVTCHGDFLMYLAFDDEYLPDDYIHEVDPFVIMSDKFDVSSPENNSYKIAELLEINTPNTPARVVKQAATEETKRNMGLGSTKNNTNNSDKFSF
jgi:hypothetical protein